MKTKVWCAVYEDVIVGENLGTSDGTGDTGTVEPKTLKEYLKTVNGAQDDLNKMMSDNRKQLTKQNQELVTQLNTVKDQFNGTAQQKEELEERIESLQNQFLTTEELAKKDKDKFKKDYEKTINKSNEERDTWKNRYTESRVQRELLDAAVGGKAISSDVIVDMLSGKTHLASKLVDGQPDGNFEVKVKFSDTDEEGNPITLDLTPEGTIKRMMELPKYGHLFESTATSGMGATSSMGSAGNKQPAFKALMEDPVAYAKWRKENPDLDVSKLRT